MGTFLLLTRTILGMKNKMIDNTNCTLEHLISRNKIFFSKETIKFHDDKNYSIINIKEKRYLKIVHKKGIAYYEIGEDLRLNYTRLMENII